MNDLVSVIIPTYNRAYIIERCIKSVLNQSYNNIEIIVIDDGSTDNTKDILAQFSDKINYIYQSNSGVSVARNAGVSVSKGMYLAFLDSDDEWLPNKIEVQYNEFEKYSDIAIVACRARLISLQGDESLTLNMGNITCDFFQIYLYPYLGIPNILLLKSAFLQVKGFDVTLKSAEDIDLFLRIAINHKVRMIDAVSTTIFQSNDSLSADTDSYENNIQVLENIQTNNRSLFIGKEKLACEVLAKIYIDYASSLLWYKNHQKAYDKLIKSLKLRYSFTAFFLLIKVKLLLIRKINL